MRTKYNKKFIDKNIRIYLILIIILFLLSNFISVIAQQKSPCTRLIESEYYNHKEEINKSAIEKTKFFILNQGQLDNDMIFFTYSTDKINYGFLESSVLIKISNNLYNNTKTLIIKLSFENSNKVLPIGKNLLSHKSNYFIGNDKLKWKSNVKNYKKIVYENLYDGIDLIYYFNKNGLKYDWIIKANTDPKNIVERFEGIDKITIDSQDRLIIKTEVGDLIEGKPYSYQKIYENIIKIDVDYTLLGDYRFSYNIKDYNPSRDLVIDPVIYSTYIGGDNNDRGKSIVLDSDNNIYITGETASSDFPTTLGCFIDSNHGSHDVFVIKLDLSKRTENHLVYSTYVGGQGWDTGVSIVVDSENNAYITGQTSSSDFPTTQDAYNPSRNGWEDVFVFKLNQDGSNLVYSTYVGGTDSDYGKSIAIDSEDNVYITGHTYSLDFPTTLGCLYDFLTGRADIFVFKLDQEGSNLVYSTYIGGNGYETSDEIVLDTDNNAYIIGYTSSENFPTTSGAYDRSFNDGETDVFVCKLNTDGSSLVYSTNLGGKGTEFSGGIVLDTDNNAYIIGCTSSENFPTTVGVYDRLFNGGVHDVFVCKLNTDGSNLVYSTYIGGSGNDAGYDIALDSESNVYLTGSTSSTDFPTTSDCYDNSHNGDSDVFVCKLDTDGSNLVYSTYLGGNGQDICEGIALDSKNKVYISGSTVSTDFPTTSNCYDSSHNGDTDVFVCKLNLTPEDGDSPWRYMIFFCCILIFFAIFMIIKSHRRKFKQSPP